MIFVIFFTLLTISFTQSQKQSEQEQIKCFQDAAELYFRTVIRPYEGFAEYGATSSSARIFYNILYTKPILPKQFKEFCQAHTTGLQAFDNCTSSPITQLQLEGFGFTNYLCKERANDSIFDYLLCLQKTYPHALAACKNECIEYENGSLNWQTPPSNSTPEEHNSYLVDDCLYLNCSAICGRPIFQSKCGDAAADFQLNSLYVMEAVVRTQLEPSEIKQQIKMLEAMGLPSNSVFAPECQRLADAASFNETIS